MRAFFIGLSAALVFGLFNGAIVYFSEGEASLLYIWIFGLIPVDWALIGIYMGMAIGFAHWGVSAADNVTVFVSGAMAALFCTLVAHAVSFIAMFGVWDINAFIKYLGLFGSTIWKFGDWYLWLSTALATLTGGVTAIGISTLKRADNIRAQLPKWISPTSRILIHVARADGKVDENEAALIVALIRAQMMKGLNNIPQDFDIALDGVISAEMDTIDHGRKLKHDLTEKCFLSSVERRDSATKLAIAVAQSDGEITEPEMKILKEIFAAWKIDSEHAKKLAADSFDEVKRLL